MLGLPSPWVLLGAALSAAALAAGSYYKGHADGEDTVQVKWDKEEARRALKAAENAQRSRDTEQSLQTAANKERAANAIVIADMDTRLDALRGELRRRAYRPAVPDTAVAGAGSEGWRTGAGLYADDGLFLAGKADLFQRIRLQRDACYRQYAEADSQLQALSAMLNEAVKK